MNKKIHYIYGAYGLAAVYIVNSSQTLYDGFMYYVCKDHLGSITHLVDENCALQEELSYDAWGRRRKPYSWCDYNVNTTHIIDRGFTQHEHLDTFGIINMNGRVYDPIVGRFLTPDPFVQAPDFTQSFNRYSYVMNNPLTFIDPSGYNQVGASEMVNNSVTIGILQMKSIDLIEMQMQAELDKSFADVINRYFCRSSFMSLIFGINKAHVVSGGSSNEPAPAGNQSEDVSTQDIPFNYVQPAYLMVEGVGINGSYNVNGIVRISDGSITVFANGKTAAGNFGDVIFSGEAQLLVDGKVTSTQNFTLPSSYYYETGTYPMGNASFNLPSVGFVQIRIIAGYVFQGPEGRILPSPCQINKIISIPMHIP